MSDVMLGQALYRVHMAQMTAMSEEPQDPIIEAEGIRIIEDRAYQGFDNPPDCSHHRFCGHIPEMYPAPRFWCRSITVERIADGARGRGIGPQAEAYAQAVDRLAHK